jgi:hypothetical protein
MEPTIEYFSVLEDTISNVEMLNLDSREK